MAYTARRSEIGPEVLGHGRRPLSPRPEIGGAASFDWGRPGPGADALALAILADHLGDDQAALQVHQEFAGCLVAGLPHDGWVLFGDEIDRAIVRALARRAA